MRRFRSAIVPLAVTATALVAAPQQAGADDSTCAPAVQNATINSDVTSLFSDYANDNSRLDDWTGGDGTYSVPLPNGDLLWIFSDTFLGRVNPDGSRSPVIEEGGDTPFLNNTFIVQDGDELSTITDGVPEEPTAVMPPRDDDHWFWAGDANRAGGIVEATYQEYERFGPGAWDWRWHRNVVARFAPGRLQTPIGVHDLPSGNGVAWASAITSDGEHTYIYGVEDHGSPKYMHIARVEGRSLLGEWEYLTADGTWSSHETDSARVMDGVANEYSVTPVGDGYVLITQDTTEVLSPNIVAYRSCSPFGPFTDKQHVYTTPETAGNVFTGNAHAHPDIEGDGLVVSYNVNTFVNTDHYDDVSIYRPRFITVNFED